MVLLEAGTGIVHKRHIHLDGGDLFLFPGVGALPKVPDFEQVDGRVTHKVFSPFDKLQWHLSRYHLLVLSSACVPLDQFGCNKVVSQTDELGEVSRQMQDGQVRLVHIVCNVREVFCILEQLSNY